MPQLQIFYCNLVFKWIRSQGNRVLQLCNFQFLQQSAYGVTLAHAEYIHLCSNKCCCIWYELSSNETTNSSPAHLGSLWPIRSLGPECNRNTDSSFTVRRVCYKNKSPSSLQPAGDFEVKIQKHSTNLVSHARFLQMIVIAKANTLLLCRHKCFIVSLFHRVLLQVWNIWIFFFLKWHSLSEKKQKAEKFM